MNTGPRRSLHVSHLEVAVREAATLARDAAWREIDEQQAKPKRRLRVVKQAKPRKKPKARPPAAAAPAAPAPLPPGSLVLSPEEVIALDHLLTTHPELRQP